MTYYVQLLGYYHGSQPGVVVYERFEDFKAMIYKEQTIDNLAAAKKCHYIVYLPKNYKCAGIDGIDIDDSNNNGDSQRQHNAPNNDSNPFMDPKSRVSATHWNMIKEFNVCSTSPMNPKLPVIPCWTPRLEKMSDPKQSFLSFIWISYILHYLFIEYIALQKRIPIDCISSKYAQLKRTTPNCNCNPLTCRQQQNGQWKVINKHKFKMSELGGFRLDADQNEFGMFASFPFGLNQLNVNKLCLRPWLKTLPYVFNTMQNCGDGLEYFSKKLAEAKEKIKLRKISEKQNWLQDPAGIDFINYTKGIVGVYMKIAFAMNNDCEYYEKAINLLDGALDRDTRDTLKCRGLKLKCLLFGHQYEAYLEELKKEKFYDEKKVHRIDSNLSWNVTFCYFLLYGRRSPKTIESVKKSIQFHCNILYILIGIKPSDCINMRNQRDLTRQLSYYYEFGHFWLSHWDVYEFIICDVLYYYLDSKSRPITEFITSSNRPFTIESTPILHNPQCINTTCPNKGSDSVDLFQCKVSRTTYFCSEQCEKNCHDKRYGIESELIKKTKRIYKHYMDKIFKYRLLEGGVDYDDEKKDSKEPKVEKMVEDNSLPILDNLQDPSNNSEEVKMTHHKTDTEIVYDDDKIRNELRGKRKSIEIEKAKMDKETKREQMMDTARKRRGSVELELET